MEKPINRFRCGHVHTLCFRQFFYFRFLQAVDALKPFHQGAPAFVAEVLSPSNRAHDLIRKLYKYKNAGVREYWVIDPENRMVLVYDFEKGKPVQEYSFQDTIPILISGGCCEVDFARIDASVARYGYK